MTRHDALTYRDILQWRAEACAQDGLMIHAAVCVMAAVCAVRYTGPSALARSRRSGLWGSTAKAIDRGPAGTWRTMKCASTI